MSAEAPSRFRRATPLALPFALPIAAAVALAAPNRAEAGGDDVYGTRGGTLLVEQDHEIALSFERGHAELRVRRTVHNGIERHDEAMFWIDVPATAVATGLRTLGELNGKPRWFTGDLLEAEAAAARYTELTGIGGYYPKDPALLSWRSQSNLALQVFPVAPGTDKTIEYTFTMPATWYDGRWHVELQAMGTAELAADVILNPGESLDQLFVNDAVVARGHRLSLEDGVSLSLAPRDPSPVELSLASVDTGSRHLVHWQVALAPELSAVPHGARVVVVLDASRSLDADTLEAQRETARAYLAHFEDPSLGAEVAVLSFDREVHALTPGFVTAGAAITALESAPLVPRNGSEVGLALDEAARLLDTTRSRAARRIVLLSDFETASRLSPEQLEARAKASKAILHLGTVDISTDPNLTRADGHRWGALAAATQGVFWRVHTPSSWTDDTRSSAKAVFEELARPIRIDELEIHAEGFEAVDPNAIDFFASELDEGQGFESLALSNAAVTKLSVEGRTWNIPVHETARPSRAEADRWSAMVFGSELLWSLSEAEMMPLAMRGGAVSPVTSYLAIEPGVRPSTEGLDEGESVGFGVGSGFGLSGRATRTPVIRAAMSPFDKRAWLESELGQGFARCGGAGSQASVSLETQTGEIVDVGLQITGFGASDANLRACMEQVTWSLELHPRFVAFETWTVTI